MGSVVVQDACVLLNLLATDRFADIATACGLKFVVASEVAKETLYLRDADSGDHKLVDLAILIGGGLLEVIELQGEYEQLRFIELAADLDDGEAASIAIAEARSFGLATDDKKARSLLQRKGINVELWSTCRVLQHWQREAAISDVELGSILANIANRARFLLKPGHPDFEWWAKTCSD